MLRLFRKVLGDDHQIVLTGSAHDVKEWLISVLDVADMEAIIGAATVSSAWVTATVRDGIGSSKTLPDIRTETAQRHFAQKCRSVSDELLVSSSPDVDRACQHVGVDANRFLTWMGRCLDSEWRPSPAAVEEFGGVTSLHERLITICERLR
jgi:hypothetical protein